MNSPVRRRIVLFGSAALSGAGVAPATALSEADGALIGIVQRALHENALSDALMAPWQDGAVGSEPDEVWHASMMHVSRFLRLRAEAVMIPAQSVAGLKAKARLALMASMERPDGTVDPESHDAIAWSLCRDVLALAEGRI